MTKTRIAVTLIGLVMVSIGTARAWDESAPGGYRWSAAVCTPNGVKEEISGRFDTRVECQASLYKRRWQPEKQRLRPGVHVVSDCEPAREVGSAGWFFTARVEFQEWYGRFHQATFTAEETCVEAIKNLTKVHGFEVDVLKNCMEFQP